MILKPQNPKTRSIISIAHRFCRRPLKPNKLKGIQIYHNNFPFPSNLTRAMKKPTRVAKTLTRALYS